MLIHNITHAFYRRADANFRYLGSLEPGAVPAAGPEQDKFEAGYLLAVSNVSFFPQMSRYEGFKSSGKLPNIENGVLLERILGLYETALPFVRVSQGGWTTAHNKLRAHLDEQYDVEGAVAARHALVTSPVGKRLARRAVATGQLYERYADYAQLGAQIIADIDKAYPEQAARLAAAAADKALDKPAGQPVQ